MRGLTLVKVNVTLVNDCVKKHLKRTPSIQIEIKNDF